MKKKPFLFVHPLLLLGVLLVLLPIFTLMTLDRLKRQKEFSTQRLLGKGLSLIQTFEAGTRTGMFTMRWGAQRIQAMLLETALQPEVVYIMITSADGRILAHSNAGRVGQVYEAMPGMAAIDEDPGLVYHRVTPSTEKKDVFEVYKRFVPIRLKFKRGHMRMHDRQPYMGSAMSDQRGHDRDSKDWVRPYIQSREGRLPEKTKHYIFAGLSMEREKIERTRLLKETVWRGIFFFILGCVGMVALFAFQAYRSASASLTRIKAFSDTVIENMPSGLLTITPDHDITSMNKAAKEMLGGDLERPAPELVDVIHEIRASQSIISREIQLELQTGRKVLLDITASPIRDSEGAIMGFLFLFRDLTQIKELKKQVETNKRLAAIGKLAAGVAHEIRNPLSSIKGFATYFGKRYEKNAADSETADIMVKEVERVNRSITQLLEFAKPMAVEKTQVDIDQMIAHSLKLVEQDLARKNIETKVYVTTEKTTIHTDPDRMNQVLLNLYINAIEALAENGLLEISVADSGASDQVEIRVTDNGRGIDETSVDLIFDPYFTTRPTGTGLGLSIVHRIVENLGGSIRVQSQKDDGTCFVITLPTS